MALSILSIVSAKPHSQPLNSFFLMKVWQHSACQCTTESFSDGMRGGSHWPHFMHNHEVSGFPWLAQTSQDRWRSKTQIQSVVLCM